MLTLTILFWLEFKLSFPISYFHLSRKNCDTLIDIWHKLVLCNTLTLTQTVTITNNITFVYQPRSLVFGLLSLTFCPHYLNLCSVSHCHSSIIFKHYLTFKQYFLTITLCPQSLIITLGPHSFTLILPPEHRRRQHSPGPPVLSVQTLICHPEQFTGKKDSKIPEHYERRAKRTV